MNRRCQCWSLATGLVVVAACAEPTSVLTWIAPDTVELYSLASPISNQPNALDFVYGSAWLVETPQATGNWDVAIDSSEDAFALRPPGSLGISSYAGVWVMEGASLDDLTVAPADSSVYVQDTPVPLAFGNAYVIRTRRTADGSNCAYYARAQLVDADLASHRVSIVFDRNPNCYDRGLIPDS